MAIRARQGEVDAKSQPEPRWAFEMLALIHDYPLRRAFDPPERVQERCGIREGMVVLDVGSGAGFFVQAPAKLVGSSGRV